MSDTGERHPFSAQIGTLHIGQGPGASFGDPIELSLTAWVAPLYQSGVVLVHLCERQCSLRESKPVTGRGTGGSILHPPLCSTRKNKRNRRRSTNNIRSRSTLNQTMRVHCRSRQSRQSCRALHLCTLRTYLKPQRYSKVLFFRTYLTPQASSLNGIAKVPLFRLVSSPLLRLFLAFNLHSRCMDSLGFAFCLSFSFEVL